MINVGPNPDVSIDSFEEKSLEEFGKEILYCLLFRV